MTCTSADCTAKIPRGHVRCLPCAEVLLAERDALAAPTRPAPRRTQRR